MPSLIPGGSFGFGIAAEVLFNKFALHVPLYRQQDPFAQLGWAPNRSTLCQIVINSAELLRPLAMLETERVLSSLVINTDDTEVTLLTPGEGKGSRKARLWIYRSNEEHARYNAFAFTNSRARAGPDEFLRDFQGTICGDCYSGYVNIEQVTDGRIAFSACNAHARRYVFNAREQCAEVSSEIVALYRLLYDIEERASRLDPVERLLLRRRESVPLMKRMEVVINSPTAMKLLPKSKLGQAVSYMRNNWDALKRFLSDAMLPIDNNEAERDLRRVAVGRKNWMFVGSEEGGERTAIILTIVASAHRHDLDVWAYLRDVLERLAKGEQTTWKSCCRTCGRPSIRNTFATSAPRSVSSAPTTDAIVGPSNGSTWSSRWRDGPPGHLEHRSKITSAIVEDFAAASRFSFPPYSTQSLLRSSFPCPHSPVNKGMARECGQGNAAPGGYL